VTKIANHAALPTVDRHHPLVEPAVPACRNRDTGNDSSNNQQHNEGT
jgi:hypothetical protein